MLYGSNILCFATYPKFIKIGEEQFLLFSC